MTENAKEVTTEKETSKLAQVIKSFEGQKPATKEEQAKIVNAFKAALANNAKALKAVADTEADLEACTLQMVRCFGKAQIKVDGKRLAISSRGDKLFYKNMSNEPDAVAI